MRMRRMIALASVALLGLTVASCSSSKSSSTSSSKNITIGIKFDQPGLGIKNPDGSFSGFDVDVARYVAGQLGYDASHVTFKEVKSADRENDLMHGVVDMIVATYSITAARKEKVDFAGPYFVAHQDLLVRSSDTSITGTASLQNKKLCSVKGSTSAQKVKDNFAKQVQLQEYGSYSECIPALLNKAVDAVTTDDIILRGFAAQHPDQLRVVGNGFSDENYGIGLPKGSKLLSKVNDAVTQMEKSGTWASALEKNLKLTASQLPAAPAIQQ
jgi:glutamate transport system substrate-binding protein